MRTGNSLGLDEIEEDGKLFKLLAYVSEEISWIILMIQDIFKIKLHINLKCMSKFNKI